jgi:hypothetical protein
MDVGSTLDDAARREGRERALVPSFVGDLEWTPTPAPALIERY